MEEYFKKYFELTSDELQQVQNLILKGGEVSSKTLAEQISKAELIAFFKVDDAIVATATIKNPRYSYKTKVFTKSKSNLLNDDFTFELGYVMVEEAFRNEKLATKLCEELCEKYSNHKLFATTKVENHGMKSILKNNNFVEIGSQYLNSSKDAFLKLFVK